MESGSYSMHPPPPRESQRKQESDRDTNTLPHPMLPWQQHRQDHGPAANHLIAFSYLGLASLLDLDPYRHMHWVGGGTAPFQGLHSRANKQFAPPKTHLPFPSACKGCPSWWLSWTQAGRGRRGSIFRWVKQLSLSKNTSLLPSCLSVEKGCPATLVQRLPEHQGP